MDVILVLLTWLVGICLCVMLIYWIVTTAIHSSKLTEELNEIKQLVQQLVNDREHQAILQVSTDAFVNEKWTCPNCFEEVSSVHYHCNNCKVDKLKKVPRYKNG